MNQVNNEQQKTSTAGMRTGCYLLLVRISAISSSMLSCSHYAELLCLISDRVQLRERV